MDEVVRLWSDLVYAMLRSSNTSSNEDMEEFNEQASRVNGALTEFTNHHRSKREKEDG